MYIYNILKAIKNWKISNFPKPLFFWILQSQAITATVVFLLAKTDLFFLTSHNHTRSVICLLVGGEKGKTGSRKKLMGWNFFVPLNAIVWWT